MALLPRQARYLASNARVRMEPRRVIELSKGIDPLFRSMPAIVPKHWHRSPIIQSPIQTLVVTPSFVEDAVRGTIIGSPRSAALEMGAGREMRDLSSKTLISVIDDDEDFRATMADLVQAMGFTVEAFASPVDFLASPNARHTSCLITDVHMPRMTGTELHSHLVGLGYDIPTILITAYPDDSARTRALGQGVVCYLSKPLDVEALLGCVRSALQRSMPKDNRS